MTHLTSDELIDAIDGRLGPAPHAHLATCVDCRRQLEDLSAVLHEAKRASVPEPSPLFWNLFSERVRTEIAAGGATGNSWPAWLRWQTLLPIGAVAAVVLALVFSVPKQQPADWVAVSDAGVAPIALVALDAPSDNWNAFADLVGELDVETASAAGVIEPGFAEQAVLLLTADERVELTRLLQAELARAKS